MLYQTLGVGFEAMESIEQTRNRRRRLRTLILLAKLGKRQIRGKPVIKVFIFRVELSPVVPMEPAIK